MNQQKNNPQQQESYPLMTEENVAKLASMTIEHYKKKAMLVSLMSGAIAIALFTLRKKIKKS